MEYSLVMPDGAESVYSVLLYARKGVTFIFAITLLSVDQF